MGKKQKILLSNYGAFCFSDEAEKLYKKLSGGKELDGMWFNCFADNYRGLEGRMDKHLIEVVERLGIQSCAVKIGGGFRIEEVDCGREFQIESYGEMSNDKEGIVYRDEMVFHKIPAEV